MRIHERAQSLRQTETPAEILLWHALKSRKLCNRRFRRQVPMEKYVADFCCFEEKLIVELDGSSHAGREDSDRVRQQWFEKQGYTVLRFENHVVYGNLSAVLRTIVDYFSEPPSP